MEVYKYKITYINELADYSTVEDSGLVISKDGTFVDAVASIQKYYGEDLMSIEELYSIGGSDDEYGIVCSESLEGLF